MIENNIIQSLGAGSGIDSRKLVTQLVDIERSGPQKRIDDKRELRETQISDFGKIKSALSTFKTKFDALIKPEGLYSKSASYTSSNTIVPTTLTTDVEPGTYKFVVQSLAQPQNLASPVFNSDDDPVGLGTLTFDFGQWDLGVTAFTQNNAKTSKTITIDGSNNSLKGLKDTINNAAMGVTASIVNTGAGFVLSINAETGANNQLQITADETVVAGVNTDDQGLSRFAFNALMTTAPGANIVKQNQAGSDAVLSVNGLPVTRSSNTISDLVGGLTLDLLKSDPAETVSITVSDDKDFAKQTTRDFVDAYNALLEELEPIIGFDKENDKRGSLANDTFAKSIIGQMRNIFASSVPGMPSDSIFTALTNLGIRTELDGSLKINDKEFDKSFADNFKAVQKMLAPAKQSDNSGIFVNSFGKQTIAGEYDVVITTSPKRGYFTGGLTDPGFVAGSVGKDYSFTLSVNGVESNLITIPTLDPYADESALANAMQGAINSDEKLKAASIAVTVAFTGGAFVVTSGKYGDTSIVNVVSSTGDAFDDLKLAQSVGTSGVNVAGTINGVVGFGSGQVLLPKLGEPSEGLTMVISESATSAKINFSRGVSGQLDKLVSNFMQSNGLISQREVNLKRDVTDLKDDEKSLDNRMTAYQERLMSQFIAMENILNGMNGSGDFLSNLFKSLPFTSGNN